MKVLLDVNILLDVALDRQPWVVEAIEISRACAEGRFEGFVSAVTVPTLFYVVRRSAGLPKAQATVALCLDSFRICPVGKPELDRARASAGSDFEDNIQMACAEGLRLDAIVTRDTGGFTASPVRALSPAELLAQL